MSSTQSRFKRALLLCAAFWSFIFYWLGARQEPFWSGYSLRGEQHDYYNLLVDGFQKGRLSMEIERVFGDGEREQLAAGKVPFVLDACYFNGRYYLYYGVTPAAVLLLPYTVFTGDDMGLETACLFFVLLGYGAGLALVLRFAARQSTPWGVGAAVNAASLLALVPGLVFLLRRSSFYDLPILSGFAFLMLSTLALDKALHESRRRWWVIAGLCWGLAVGSRANLFLFGICFPLLAYASATQWRARMLNLARAAAGAMGPGLLLALYNYARFGSLFDFGFSHGMNSYFATDNPLAAARFFGSNLYAYLISPPTFAPWFPFIYPIADTPLPHLYSNPEAMHGFAAITVVVVSLVGIGLFARARCKTPLLLPGLAIAALLLYSLGELTFTLVLGIRAYRYACDFLTPIAVLALLLGAPLWSWKSNAGRASLWMLNTLLGFAACICILGAVQQFDGFEGSRPREFAFWSKVLNPRFQTLSALSGAPIGDAEMILTFQKPEKGTIVPILRTGLPSAYDEFRAVVHPGGFVELGFFHSGYGGPSSQFIPIDWGKPYRVSVRMGSLYPPETDAYFAGESKQVRFEKKTRAVLKLEDQVVINRQMRFNESAPWVRNLKLPSDAENVDCVQVSNLRFGENKEAFTSLIPKSVYVLEAELTHQVQSRPLPVICMGITGEGNLLLLEPLASGEYRFALDVWGVGLLRGRTFAAPPSGSVRVEIVVGPLLNETFVDRNDLSSLASRIMVRVDEALVGDFTVTKHTHTLNIVAVGTNAVGFSSAEPAYSGRLQMIDSSAAETEQVLRRFLEEAAKSKPSAFK